MRAVSRFVVAMAVAAAAVLLVPASVGTSTASASVRAALPSQDVVPIPGQPSTYKRYAPAHYTPPNGPRFNNPYGSKSSRRTLLTHVIKTINSVPGYRLPAGIDPATGKKVACPTNPAEFPNTIKIALYSIADQSFVDALIAAHRRCVSVKLLMNSHLNVDNSPSWRRLINGLGAKTGGYANERSFAYRCSNGCIGSTVLHSKFYLFSQAGHSKSVMMTGSSNMTSNAVRVQWNDLFTVDNDQSLYDTYTNMWNRMVPDHRGNGPFIYQSGGYTSTFYPMRQATRNTDKTLAALRTIHCNGATGDARLQGAHRGVRRHARLARQARPLPRAPDPGHVRRGLLRADPLLVHGARHLLPADPAHEQPDDRAAGAVRRTEWRGRCEVLAHEGVRRLGPGR